MENKRPGKQGRQGISKIKVENTKTRSKSQTVTDTENASDAGKPNKTSHMSTGNGSLKTE